MALKTGKQKENSMKCKDQYDWQISSKTDKEEREKTQTNIIKHKTENITTDPTAIKTVIKEYHEELYRHKFDNLNETDQFLEKHKLPQLTHCEIDNFNSPVTTKKNKFII